MKLTSEVAYPLLGKLKLDRSSSHPPLSVGPLTVAASALSRTVAPPSPMDGGCIKLRGLSSSASSSRSFKLPVFQAPPQAPGLSSSRPPPPRMAFTLRPSPPSFAPLHDGYGTPILPTPMARHHSPPPSLMGPMAWR